MIDFDAAHAVYLKALEARDGPKKQPRKRRMTFSQLAAEKRH